MKKTIVKFSGLPSLLRNAITEKMEQESLESVSFPYKGNMEKGFIYVSDETTYLVINDQKKVSRIDEVDDEDVDIDDDSDIDTDSDIELEEEEEQDND